jgi:hypothetical protein
MSSSVSLALAAKMNLILSPEGAGASKFISFIPPLTTLQFKFSELDFFSDNTDANTLELNRSNFAEVVNQVPADNIIFTPADRGLLWDVFENSIINNSVTATAALNDDEKDKLERAKKFSEEFFPVYKSYKNALDQCQLDYREAKCSIEFATGDEKLKLQTEWEEYREKDLLDRIAAAENELLITGKKTEVLEALSTIKNIEAKKGISTLKNDISLKLQGLFSKGVPDRAGTEYIYTDFSPVGSFEEDSPAWSQVILYSSEIDSLCAQAPEALKTMFADEVPVLGLESISFEYTLVSVVREWFSEELICSTNWKFALDNGQPVSDGKIPASGLIPSYINKILCIRKLSYRLKKTALPTDKIKIAIVSAIPVKDFSIKKQDAPVPGTTRFPFLKRESITARPISMVRGARPARAATATVRDHRTSSATGTTLQQWRKKQIAKFIKTTPLKTNPAVQGETTTEHPFQGIKFIAFECKRVSLSPNPDPSLQWD